MFKQFYRGIATMLAVVVIFTLPEQRFPAFAAEVSQKTMVTISVRSSQSSELESRLDIDSPEIAQALNNAKKENVTNASCMTDIYVTMLQGNQEKRFRLEQSGNLWDESELKRLVLPRNVSSKLLNYADTLRKNHYGKLISWEDAEHIVSRKSIFSITDLETGLTFQVQRRAGNDHADVQPLTKEDTKIMKQIYHGRWSWKRKAILVHSGHEWLAASMNGMPHGGDGIPDNGFSGHFCVHFFQSTTHRSNDPDLAHQLMVHKAAGNLRSFFDSASPLILAESFVEAMNQQDSEILRQVSEGIAKEKFEFFIQEMESLMSIRTKKHRGSGNTDNTNDSGWDENLSVELELQVAIHKKGDSKRNIAYLFIFNRKSKQSPWRIEDIANGEQGTQKEKHDSQNQSRMSEDNDDNNSDRTPISIFATRYRGLVTHTLLVRLCCQSK
jgi:hypothetical protein